VEREWAAPRRGHHSIAICAGNACRRPASRRSPFHARRYGVPDYLSTHYWWAYIHPKTVRLFELSCLVNLILWGNYGRSRWQNYSAFRDYLQVACVYGDLTNQLNARVCPRAKSAMPSRSPPKGRR
jgi:hypothetical protein